MIRHKSVQPGSVALNNERKIAEAIALRSAELRAVLSREGKAHADFLSKCAEEKRTAKAEVAKLNVKLMEVRVALADITSPYYDEKRKWLSGKKENEALRAELVAKLHEAKESAETQRAKAEAITKIETDLKGRFTKREEAVGIRETSVTSREASSKLMCALIGRDDKRLRDAVKALSDNELDYAVRFRALLLRERAAEAILTREAKTRAEEMRVDLKAKAVQDKDKALQVERVGIARERARLGRIKHGLKTQGVAK